MTLAMSEGRKASNKKSAPERRRRRGARPVGDLLPSIGGASFRRFGFVQSSVVSRWPEIVGERYAEIAIPESIRFPAGRKSEGTLHLSVSGGHATVVQHIAPEIVERVNRFFGYPAVARIAIQQGRTPAPPRERRAPPSLRPVPSGLGESVREIADPELKACLEGLAASVAATTSPVTGDAPQTQQLQVKRLGDIGRDEQNGVSDQ